MTAPLEPGRAEGSALERLAARLLAQRAFLAEAARRIAAIPGPVFEIGLGKGRTYDHLRRLLPGRAIYCFDREHHAPPEESPAAEFLVLGEIQATLPALAARLGAGAALAHCDIGTRKPARDMDFARYLAAALPGFMAPGGIVLGDRPMDSPRLAPLPAPAIARPDGIAAWPYYLYRVAAA
ncbi:MAG: class I SAM-dependent methyltransferase [Alphaproteobacteria bacterium]